MGLKSLAIILLLAAATPLGAQDRSPRLDLQMPAPMTRVDAPTASLASVLSEGHRRELLAAGFPAVLHCRVELWKRTLFLTFARDALIEWDLVVEYVPATGHYQVRRQQDGKLTEQGDVTTIEDAEQIVDRPYRVPMAPRSSGARYFYLFSVDLSTLSLSDLDAWQRWVRGEAAPAAHGKTSIITAIKNGLGSLLSRVLGGETQHYEVRRPFTAG